jgi:hypothetical protein
MPDLSPCQLPQAGHQRVAQSFVALVTLNKIIQDIHSLDAELTELGSGMGFPPTFTASTKRVICATFARGRRWSNDLLT